MKVFSLDMPEGFTLYGEWQVRILYKSSCPEKPLLNMIEREVNLQYVPDRCPVVIIILLNSRFKHIKVHIQIKLMVMDAEADASSV